MAGEAERSSDVTGRGPGSEGGRGLHGGGARVPEAEPPLLVGHEAGDAARERGQRGGHEAGDQAGGGAFGVRLPAAGSLAAMAAAMPPPLLLLALLGAFAARGQDFDLSDALDDPKKPLPTPKKPSGGGAADDLDLSDALGGHDPQPPPPRPPPPRPRDPQKPDPKPAGGDFSNSDLEDAAGGRGKPRPPVTSPPPNPCPPMTSLSQIPAHRWVTSPPRP